MRSPTGGESWQPPQQQQQRHHWNIASYPATPTTTIAAVVIRTGIRLFHSPHCILCLSLLVSGAILGLGWTDHPSMSYNCHSDQYYRHQQQLPLVTDNSVQLGSTLPTAAVTTTPTSKVSVSNVVELHQQQTTTTTMPLPPQPLPRPIRLLRIPKAGSSSFSAFLRLQYNCTSPSHPPGDCTRHNQKNCPSVHGCTNHLQIPNWQPLKTLTHVSKATTTRTNETLQRSPSKPATIPIMVTFVRDPIARYKSAYRYPGHHGLGTRGNISLHTLLFPEYDNVQTSYLARHPIGTWHLPHGNQPRTAAPNSTVPDAAEWASRLRDATALINATERLLFVGLVEYWNDSLRLFCRIYTCTRLEDSLHAKPERQTSSSSLPGNRDVVHHSSRSPVDDATVAAVRQANAMDAQLYTAAVARFCRDLARYQRDEAFMTTLQEETIQLCLLQFNNNGIQYAQQ